jgi:hypothetical protein
MPDRQQHAVHISNRDRQRALKSLKRLYLAQFGQDGLSDTVRQFSRAELVDVYQRNMRFWVDHTPEVKPGLSQFTLAKHAICTNAIENLWSKIDAHGIRDLIDA